MSLKERRHPLTNGANELCWLLRVDLLWVGPRPFSRLWMNESRQQELRRRETRQLGIGMDAPSSIGPASLMLKEDRAWFLCCLREWGEKGKYCYYRCDIRKKWTFVQKMRLP
ncbi:uncharacterized protein MYCFIDRAFT_204737 [Pseudocercospora fijiensis CIRAD86]|uniref:Uncharacterized protein n=1 Tax=Pseudocercospora fijiensis (strain CIRAD86) TaxID=383855 RepID=M3AP54_PSEFD|nr:uncharacterized protein MYCFIDRAFT_204737 [Pseudocercospora fijiensis CIRAD86]EME79217.1 hypothetical protein MYCFIDRAFT_204737 [Pseudocercospora fijiensis CIRAD86]